MINKFIRFVIYKIQIILFKISIKLWERSEIRKLRNGIVKAAWKEAEERND